MMRSVIYLAAIFAVMACSEKRETSEEQKSLVKIVIEPEASGIYDGFKIKDYYTGVSIAEIRDSLDLEFSVFRDTLSIKEADFYYPQIMAATSNYNEGASRLINLSLKNLANDSVEQVDITVPQQHALRWFKADTIALALKPAQYLIEMKVERISKSSLYVDQILLTNQANFQPKGYEFEEEITERMLPPAWSFGVLYGSYANQEGSVAIVNNLIDNGYPIDGFWTDSWFWDYTREGYGPAGYLDFVGDTVGFPDMAKMWTQMEQQNIKSGIWVWDAIQKDGNEEVFDYFLENNLFRSEPFFNTNGWHNKSKGTLLGNIDFSNEDAVEEWKKRLGPFFEKGVDFMKLDKSASIDYLKASFELTQQFATDSGGRGFIMSHLHTTYDPKAKKYPIKWSGDAKISWNQPDYPNMGNYSMGGLKQNILMAADPNRSTYENIFMANDIGGYNYFGSKDFGDELYMRWAQFGMFGPISTVFSTADNPSGNLPFNFSKAVADNFKYYANLKLQLFPYIYSYAHQAITTGVKVRRGDGINTTQFLFGNELLVAPVYEKQAISREVFFPEGSWINFYTGEIVQGGQSMKIDAPLHQIPLFVKGGAIIPMRNKALNVLSGNNDLLKIHLYPLTSSSFELIEDDGISNSYLDGAIMKTMFTNEHSDKLDLINIAKSEGEFEGMPLSRDYEFYVYTDKQPKSITAEGQALEFEKITLRGQAVIVIKAANQATDKSLSIKISY